MTAVAIRLVTTTYTNSTELAALEALADAGVDVQVSYDTPSTRLHAKAWLFRRSEWLLNGVHRLVESHALRESHGSGVERARLRRA